MRRMLAGTIVVLALAFKAFGEDIHEKIGKVAISEDAKDYAISIKANEKDLQCLACHFPGNTIRGKEVKDIGILTHPTGKQLSCLSCHDPGARNRYLLKKDFNCLNCHREYADALEGPHKSKRGCLFCHSVHNAQGGHLSKMVYGEISPLETPEDGFCLACHDPEGMAQHKVFQSVYSEHPLVAQNPSPDLPGKKIGCSTCHDPHAKSKDLLRYPLKNDTLCSKCHAELTEKLKRSAHASLKEGCLSCHTIHNPQFHALWAKAPSPGKTVNEKMCASCHAISRKCKENLTKPLAGNMIPVNPMTGHPARGGKEAITDCISCHPLCGK